jgi:hypothetical protein
MELPDSSLIKSASRATPSAATHGYLLIGLLQNKLDKPMGRVPSRRICICRWVVRGSAPSPSRPWLLRARPLILRALRKEYLQGVVLVRVASAKQLTAGNIVFATPDHLVRTNDQVVVLAGDRVSCLGEVRAVGAASITVECLMQDMEFNCAEAR